MTIGDYLSTFSSSFNSIERLRYGMFQGGDKQGVALAQSKNPSRYYPLATASTLLSDVAIGSKTKKGVSERYLRRLREKRPALFNDNGWILKTVVDMWIEDGCVS